MVTSFTDASFDLLGFSAQSLAHCDAVGEGGIHSIIIAIQKKVAALLDEMEQTQERSGKS
jgi:hypothetical protein